MLLQGSAALVLLIGCVNVASLLLARANAMRPELAVRHALGAGRVVLLRQMLVESILLVSLAGASGMMIGDILVSIAGQAVEDADTLLSRRLATAATADS